MNVLISILCAGVLLVSVFAPVKLSKGQAVQAVQSSVQDTLVDSCAVLRSAVSARTNAVKFTIALNQNDLAIIGHKISEGVRFKSADPNIKSE